MIYNTILLIYFIILLFNNSFNQNYYNYFENSVFAIVKISYNIIGETMVTGGICGTAFLLNDSTAVTANHVLNKVNYMPSPGFKHVQYWLLRRNIRNIIELNKEDIIPMPKIDCSTISLRGKIQTQYKITYITPDVGDQVYNFGHVPNMPITLAHWDNKLVVDDYILEKSKADKKGKIISINFRSVQSQDVNILNKLLIQPSFIAKVGMSGGPLIKHDKIIGLMSFGFPIDSLIKNEVYAISINEILDELKR